MITMVNSKSTKIDLDQNRHRKQLSEQGNLLCKIHLQQRKEINEDEESDPDIIRQIVKEELAAYEKKPLKS